MEGYPPGFVPGHRTGHQGGRFRPEFPSAPPGFPYPASSYGGSGSVPHIVMQVPLSPGALRGPQLWFNSESQGLAPFRGPSGAVPFQGEVSLPHPWPQGGIPQNGGGFRNPVRSPGFGSGLTRPAWVEDILAQDFAAPGNSQGIGGIPPRGMLSGSQRSAQTSQRLAQTPQRLAQTPQRSAQTPQRSAQTPQRLAQTPEQSAQTPRKREQEEEGRGGPAKRARNEISGARNDISRGYNQEAGTLSTGRQDGGLAVLRSVGSHEIGMGSGRLENGRGELDTRERSGSQTSSGAGAGVKARRDETRKGASEERIGVKGRFSLNQGDAGLDRGRRTGNQLTSPLRKRADWSNEVVSPVPRSPLEQRSEGFPSPSGGHQGPRVFQLSTPLQRHQDPGIPPKSSPLADAIKQKVQLWQSAKAGAGHTGGSNTASFDIGQSGGVHIDEGRGRVSDKKEGSPANQSGGQKPFLGRAERGERFASSEGGDQRSVLSSPAQLSQRLAEIRERFSATPPKMVRPPSAEAPSDPVRDFVVGVKDSLSAQRHKNSLQQTPNPKPPQRGPGNERLARIKQRLSITPPPPERNPVGGARTTEPQTPAANTRLAQIKERLSFPAGSNKAHDTDSFQKPPFSSSIRPDSSPVTLPQETHGHSFNPTIVRPSSGILNDTEKAPIPAMASAMLAELVPGSRGETGGVNRGTGPGGTVAEQPQPGGVNRHQGEKAPMFPQGRMVPEKPLEQGSLLHFAPPRPAQSIHAGLSSDFPSRPLPRNKHSVLLADFPPLAPPHSTHAGLLSEFPSGPLSPPKHSGLLADFPPAAPPPTTQAVHALNLMHGAAKLSKKQLKRSKMLAQESKELAELQGFVGLHNVPRIMQTYWEAKGLPNVANGANPPLGEPLFPIHEQLKILRQVARKSRKKLGKLRKKQALQQQQQPLGGGTLGTETGAAQRGRNLAAALRGEKARIEPATAAGGKNLGARPPSTAGGAVAGTTLSAVVGGGLMGAVTGGANGPAAVVTVSDSKRTDAGTTRLAARDSVRGAEKAGREGGDAGTLGAATEKGQGERQPANGATVSISGRGGLAPVDGPKLGEVREPSTVTGVSQGLGQPGKLLGLKRKAEPGAEEGALKKPALASLGETAAATGLREGALDGSASHKGEPSKFKAEQAVAKGPVHLEKESPTSFPLLGPLAKGTKSFVAVKEGAAGKEGAATGVESPVPTVEDVAAPSKTDAVPRSTTGNLGNPPRSTEAEWPKTDGRGLRTLARESGPPLAGLVHTSPLPGKGVTNQSPPVSSAANRPANPPPDHEPAPAPAPGPAKGTQIPNPVPSSIGLSQKKPVAPGGVASGPPSLTSADQTVLKPQGSVSSVDEGFLAVLRAKALASQRNKPSDSERGVKTSQAVADVSEEAVKASEPPVKTSEVTREATETIVGMARASKLLKQSPEVPKTASEAVQQLFSSGEKMVKKPAEGPATAAGTAKQSFGAVPNAFGLAKAGSGVPERPSERAVEASATSAGRASVLLARSTVAHGASKTATEERPQQSRPALVLSSAPSATASAPLQKTSFTGLQQQGPGQNAGQTNLPLVSRPVFPGALKPSLKIGSVPNPDSNLVGTANPRGVKLPEAQPQQVTVSLSPPKVAKPSAIPAPTFGSNAPFISGALGNNVRFGSSYHPQKPESGGQVLTPIPGKSGPPASQILEPSVKSSPGDALAATIQALRESIHRQTQEARPPPVSANVGRPPGTNGPPSSAPPAGGAMEQTRRVGYIKKRKNVLVRRVTPKRGRLMGASETVTEAEGVVSLNETRKGAKTLSNETFAPLSEATLGASGRQAARGVERGSSGKEGKAGKGSFTNAGQKRKALSWQRQSGAPGAGSATSPHTPLLQGPRRKPGAPFASPQRKQRLSWKLGGPVTPNGAPKLGRSLVRNTSKTPLRGPKIFGRSSAKKTGLGGGLKVGKVGGRQSAVKRRAALKWTREGVAVKTPGGKIRQAGVLPSSSDKGSLLTLLRQLRGQRSYTSTYAKSTSGLSLKRTGAVGLKGNLKWTLSGGKRRKEAAEKAAQAAAQAVRGSFNAGKGAGRTAIGGEGSLSARKRRAVAAARATARSKRASLAAGLRRRPGAGPQDRERVISVGLATYKMDATGRTLVRVSEPATPGAVTLPTTTPRRASVNGRTFVRQGTSDRLVIDPTSVRKTLASGRLKWSLQNARRRKATKGETLCPYFTKYGKCNREGASCLYVHDRDKVAICTKFVLGRCENPDCTLTHKIIPERMPVCTYFLEGTCTNERCPFRHVSVAPDAPVCRDFLQGFCPRGDTCPNKHTSVCPKFAADGECQEGNKCRFYHPTKRTWTLARALREAGRKRKRAPVSKPQTPPDLGEGGILLPPDDGSDSDAPQRPRVRRRYFEADVSEVARKIKPAFLFDDA